MAEVRTPELILFIDDDESAQAFVAAILARHGYSVSVVGEGQAALEQAIALSPHLVILDLCLPGMSGIEVCKALRQWYQAPILVLSGSGGEDTIVEALDMGADDFLGKPFRPGELLARIRALLRRSSGQPGRAAVLRAGDLEVDFARRRVKRGDQAVDLTRTEFEVVALLMRNVDCVVTSETILGEIWGPHHGEYSQTLRVHIGHIRKKIEPDSSKPIYLLTEPGVGYRLQEPPASESAAANPAKRGQ